MVAMKTLEKGQEKIKKICAALREETLEPAQQEARDIIKAAHKQAENIVAEAHKAAEKLQASARASIEKEQNAFQSSLQQAATQSIEVLKQSIESKFFTENLYSLIEKSAADPQLIANLLNAIVKALDKEGLAVNLTALIPKTVPERKVNELLLHEVLGKLKDQSVVAANFAGGAKVTLNNKKVTIDISEAALRELLSSHIVRKDFRKLVFGS